MSARCSSGPIPEADAYRTLGAPSTAEFKDRGSRFIAEAVSVQSEDEAQAHLEAVRRREAQATHHAWAYRLGPEGRRFRYHDGGEPTGTAGPPLLRQIDAYELTGVLVVVTRYFGGTKLGTGGLARAYGRAADGALKSASIQKRVKRRCVRITFDYDDTGPARRLVERFGATVEEEHYGERAALEVGVPRSQVDAFRSAFRDVTSGRGVSGLVEAGAHEKREQAYEEE